MDLRCMVSNYILEYIKYCKDEKNLSKITTNSYRNVLNIYLDNLDCENSNNLNELFYNSFENYINCVLKYSSNTIGVHFVVVKLFLQYLESKCVIEPVSKYYNINTVYYLKNYIMGNDKSEIMCINALNSVSKEDIEYILCNIVSNAFDTKKSFVKKQRMFLDSVILILNYYFVFNNEELLSLKDTDVVIDDDMVKICKTNHDEVSSWFVLTDNYCVNVIKEYYNMSKELINKSGYFLVNCNTKKAINLYLLERVVLNYSKYNRNKNFQINNRNIIKLRLMHLLKEDKPFNYIQGLFLFNTEYLLDRIDMYKKICNINYTYKSETQVVM